jgi:hypothetical protein
LILINTRSGGGGEVGQLSCWLLRLVAQCAHQLEFIGKRLLWVDAVEKVGGKRLLRNN